MEGLKKLEYRGYDSWGIAALSSGSKGRISVVKKVGKIGKVSRSGLLRGLGSDGDVAIGHTRWATHGGISEINSHPHLDCGMRIAVVHNGVIENYQQLKKGLVGRKHKFLSQTDTEVIPHLIEEYISKKGTNFADAVMGVARTLEGRSAFVALDANSEMVVAVRRGSPLIIGVGEAGGFYICSDVNAFLDRTNKVMYLDDDEMVVMPFGEGSEKAPKFFSVISGKEVKKRVVEIYAGERKDVGKSGYDHFLMKEIMEQKQTIAQAINQDDKKIMDVAKSIRNAFGVFLIGSGTAGRVCATGDISSQK